MHSAFNGIYADDSDVRGSDASQQRRLSEAKALRKQASFASDLAMSLQTPDEGLRTEARVQAEESLSNRRSYIAARPDGEEDDDEDDEDEKEEAEVKEKVGARAPASAPAPADDKVTTAGSDGACNAAAAPTAADAAAAEVAAVDPEASEMELLKQEIALLESSGGKDDGGCGDKSDDDGDDAAPTPPPPPPAVTPRAFASSTFKPAVAAKPKMPPKTSPRRKAPKPAPRRPSAEALAGSTATTASPEPSVVMRREKLPAVTAEEKEKRLSRRASYVTSLSSLPFLPLSPSHPRRGFFFFWVNSRTLMGYTKPHQCPRVSRKLPNVCCRAQYRRLTVFLRYIEERQVVRSAVETAATSAQEAAIATHAGEAKQIALAALDAEKAAEEEAAKQRLVTERQKEVEKEAVHASRAEVRKQQAQLAKQRAERAEKLELSERASKLVGTRRGSRLNLFGDGAGAAVVEEGAGVGTGTGEATVAVQAVPVRPEDEWGYGKSKIWKALNPRPIAFQTGRDRDEREVNKVTLRGQEEQRSDYAFLNDVGREDAMSPEDYAENIVEAEDAEIDAMEALMGGGDDAYASSEEEEAEEEDVDPNALDDIDDDFMMQMMANRAGREKEAEARKAKLREEYVARKKKEDEDLARELAIIRARQSIEDEKRSVEKAKGLKEAQDRLANDLVFSFTWGGAA